MFNSESKILERYDSETICNNIPIIFEVSARELYQSFKQEIIKAERKDSLKRKLKIQIKMNNV